MPAGPDGRPVVYLLHGLLGTARAHFGPQIRDWRTDHRVVAIDLPGHGRCSRDAAADYLDDALDYVLTVLGHYGRGAVVAASHLGGPLAVRAAAARADLVSSLVLTGFVPGTDRASFLRLLAGFRVLAEESPDLVAEYVRLHGERWSATLVAFGRHAEQEFERTVRVGPDTLAGLPQPVLICNGSHRSAERAAAESAAAIGSRVSGRVLHGAGHIAGLDAPAEFSAAARGFWRSQAGAAA